VLDATVTRIARDSGKIIGPVQRVAVVTALPDSLHQIKVLETIKEGTTVFALTPDEQRKAELMHKPDSRGDYAFSRALGAARDALRVHSRDDEAHELSCMSDIFVDLAAAMAGGSDVATATLP